MNMIRLQEVIGKVLKEVYKKDNTISIGYNVISEEQVEFTLNDTYMMLSIIEKQNIKIISLRNGKECVEMSVVPMSVIESNINTLAKEIYIQYMKIMGTYESIKSNEYISLEDLKQTIASSIGGSPMVQVDDNVYKTSVYSTTKMGISEKQIIISVTITLIGDDIIDKEKINYIIETKIVLPDDIVDSQENIRREVSTSSVWSLQLGTSIISDHLQFVSNMMTSLSSLYMVKQ